MIQAIPLNRATALSLLRPRALTDDTGEISIEYVLIAAGMLVLVFSAFSYLGGSVSDFVRSLPALLGFG
jgi:Flp pilus assembly pilin Flp